MLDQENGTFEDLKLGRDWGSEKLNENSGVGMQIAMEKGTEMQLERKAGPHLLWWELGTLSLVQG